MKSELSSRQIANYQKDGFVVIEDFLTVQELDLWRAALDEALKNRKGNKFAGPKPVHGKGDDVAESRYGVVFDQMIHLWQNNECTRSFVPDRRIAKLTAELAQVNGIRIWHDQALMQITWANPAAWRLNTPYCYPGIKPAYRRAMTCAYRFDGNVFNGIQSILSDEEVAELRYSNEPNHPERNLRAFSRNR